MLKYIAPLIITLGAASLSSAQDYQTEISEAERLGRMLYDYDSAAWGASDALFSNESAKAAFLEAPIGLSLIHI